MVGKSVMKNAYLPKISVLLRFGVEILALLCPDDSIQILLILPQFQTFGSEAKLEGFVWSHRGITELNISTPNRNKMLIFGK